MWRISNFCLLVIISYQIVQKTNASGSDVLKYCSWQNYPFSIFELWSFYFEGCELVGLEHSFNIKRKQKYILLKQIQVEAIGLRYSNLQTKNISFCIFQDIYYFHSTMHELRLSAWNHAKLKRTLDSATSYYSNSYYFFKGLKC